MCIRYWILSDLLILSLEEQRSVVERAHRAWGAGDLEVLLSLLHDDIIHLSNVDGMQVPYASSAVGKADVEFRLTLIRTIFDLKRFSIERLVHGPEYTTSSVHAVYRHKRTGEILDVMIRFNAWVKDGLLTRVEEFVDARYLEAYERFVFHMQSVAEQAASD